MRIQSLALAIMIAVSLSTSGWADTGEAPIQGNVTYQVTRTPQVQLEQKPKGTGFLNSILSLFDRSDTLETDQVATSVARFFLAQDVPKSAILIPMPETKNKATEQFKAYLSATLLHAGYPIGQPTAADIPQARFVPFAVYPYQDGVIIKLVVGKTQMTRFYALDSSGEIKSASAYLLTQVTGETP